MMNRRVPNDYTCTYGRTMVRTMDSGKACRQDRFPLVVHLSCVGGRRLFGSSCGPRVAIHPLLSVGRALLRRINSMEGDAGAEEAAKQKQNASEVPQPSEVPEDWYVKLEETVVQRLKAHKKDMRKIIKVPAEKDDPQGHARAARAALQVQDLLGEGATIIGSVARSNTADLTNAMRMLQEVRRAGCPCGSAKCASGGRAGERAGGRAGVEWVCARG
jgi:hypothetical protein